MVNKKTAVIGDPIDHSLSPKIHNHWIESEKIDVGAYQKINVKKENFQSNGHIMVATKYKNTVINLKLSPVPSASNN